MAKDYYQILGIPRNASEDEIKRAYRKLAMQYHPDRNPGKEKWANDKFKDILIQIRIKNGNRATS